MKSSSGNLNLLLAGQFVSQVGDRFYMLALSFMVLNTTGSTIKMGSVLAAALIPSLILGLIAGTFIDRCNRKMILVGADFFRGVIISMVAILFYFDLLSFPLILVSQVLLSVNSAFFDPAVSAIIPQIVNRDELLRANSKHQFINGFAAIIGPAVGGVCVAYFGYTVIFAVNAFSFFFSAIFELFIRFAPGNGGEKIKTGFSKDLVAGYKYILKKQSLMIIFFMVGIIHSFVGSIEVFIPVIALSFKENGPQALGYIHTAFGFGIVLITFLLSVKKILWDEPKVLFTSVFLIGVAFLLLVLAGVLWSESVFIYLPLFVFLGCLIILAGISFKTLLQKNVDNDFAGRVFSIAGSIGNSSIPFAMIVFGFLLEFFSLNNLLCLCGIVLLPLSLIFYKLYKGSENG